MERQTIHKLAGAAAAIVLLAGLSGCSLFCQERPVYTEEDTAPARSGPSQEGPQDAQDAQDAKGWGILLEDLGDGLYLTVNGAEEGEKLSVRLQEGERVSLRLSDGRTLVLSADDTGEVSILLQEETG